MNLFNYSDFRIFLRDYYKTRKASSEHFSIRSWGRRLGVKSPGTIEMLLNGKRNPGDSMMERINNYFEFSRDEREYFEVLVKIEKLSASQLDYTAKINELKIRLQELRPEQKVNVLDLASFGILSKWYYGALLEVVSLKEFKEDYDWISEKLFNRVSASEVQESLGKLLEVGLLVRNVEGRLIQAEDQVGTSHDISSDEIKGYHEQVIELAKKSVRDIEVEEREISSSTFKFSAKDLSSIKDDLRKMRRKIYQKYEKEDGDGIFQLNLQLFPLTTVEREGSVNV